MTVAAAASSEPLLTVVIPAYNAEASITGALASVLSETTVSLECIVVDDASSDRTARMVEEVQARDARVVLLRQDHNAGVSEARNRALDMARGAWVTFVDADDRVVPGAFAAMLRAAEAQDGLVVIGQRVSSDGQRTWTLGHHLHPDLRVPGRKSLLRNPGLLNNVGSVGKLFHQSSIAGRRFAGRSLGDHPWVLGVTLRAGDRVVVVDDTVYEWIRPTRANDFTTITADRERSIGPAVQAVAMAGIAWRAMAAEWAQVASPTQRHTLDVAYLDRLVRADLARMLVNAVLRRDPGCAELIEALTGLLVALPAEVVADAHTVGDRLVRPVVAFWWLVPADAWAAVGALVRAATPRTSAGPARRYGILRNPGLAWIPLGGGRRWAGLLLAWPHAAGSLVLERLARAGRRATRR
jgi:hypothetical protein